MAASDSEARDGESSVPFSGSSSEGTSYVPSVAANSSDSFTSNGCGPYFSPSPEPSFRGDPIHVDCNLLPPRLFATDMYPSDGRVNSYSKLQYLIDLVEILHDTAEMSTLLESPFGHLFRLPTSRCSLSGKLVHNILCRQLVCHNPHEAWFTFGGQPLRFSITEFEHLTGLCCGPFPSRALIRKHQSPASATDCFWFELFGDDESVTIPDIVAMLKSTPRMPASRRLRLALIVIVDGILLCGTQPVTPSFKTVEMVRDVAFFLKYPWGRESFMLTLRMMKVGVKVTSLEKLVNKLKQSSVALHGFPLAIQLLVFQSVPALLEYLPHAFDSPCFLDRELKVLPKLKTYHTGNILEVENRPKLRVTPVLCNTQKYNIDICSDVRVFRVQNLICRGHIFSKSDWVGGDASLEPLCLCSTKGNRRSRCSVCCGLGDPCPPLDVPSGSATPTRCDDCSEFATTVARLASVDSSLAMSMKSFIREEFLSFRDSLVQNLVEMAHTRSVDPVQPHASHPVEHVTTQQSSSTDNQCSVSSSLSVRSLPIRDAKFSSSVKSAPPLSPARMSGGTCPVYLTRQKKKAQLAREMSADNVLSGDLSASVKRVKRGNGFDSSARLCSTLFPFRVPTSQSIEMLKAKQKSLQTEGNVISIDGQSVRSTFFTDIGSPQHWLSNVHIDIIMRTLWRSRSEYLIANGITVVDCFFTRFLASNYAAFSKHASGVFKWPNILRDYVLGYVVDRSEVCPWLQDVHTVYAPMNWGSKHWVALVIHLHDWHVEILDPLVSMTSDRAVKSHMKCVVTMLPSLLRAFCPSEISASLRAMDFTFTRLLGVSQNERTGDCGPLAVKFMELHSHKYRLSGITDEMVNALRWDYAIAVYTAFIGPIS